MNIHVVNKQFLFNLVNYINVGFKCFLFEYIVILYAWLNLY